MRRELPLLCLLLCLGTGACDSTTKTSTTTATPAPSPSATAAATTAGSPEAGMTMSPSGLQYQDVVVGDGQRPLFNQVVRVRYSGYLKDGTKFDSNVDNDKPILEFTIGRGEVIKGWEMGIGGTAGIPPMRVGGKRTLIIPPELGFGKEPYGTIPANSTLRFEVTLVGVKR